MPEKALAHVVEALGAGRGDEAAVLAWLDCGGQVNATFGEGEMSGVTVLMLAACNGRERVVDLLLQRGAEVNLQDSDGDTALMAAASQGHERVVDLLLRAWRDRLQARAARDFAPSNGTRQITVAQIHAGGATPSSRSSSVGETATPVTERSWEYLRLTPGRSLLLRLFVSSIYCVY